MTESQGALLFLFCLLLPVWVVVTVAGSFFYAAWMIGP